MLQRELGRTAVQANGRNVVARLRPVAGRRHAVFKGVRPSVRVFAEAPAAGQAAKAPAMRLEDVKEGAEYEGTVTAVEEFGAFVDFGAGTNGLVHISKLQAGFTKNAKDVVSAGAKVTVKVLGVDVEKKRISLALTAGANAAAAAPAAAESSVDEDVVDEPAEDAGAAEVEEDVEVELEEGQVEVRAELPGFEDIPFVMDEDNADELTEAAVSALEQDLDSAEIVYNLEAPAYMEEVSGKVVRVEDYGAFVEFQWNNKALTGLLSRDEMKVPSSALSEEAQAELRAEWADTEFEMPAYADLPDNELDVKKYYAVGQEVTAFVLETPLVDGRGISLTHFTDEDVAAEAVEAYEAIDEDEDEELDALLEDAAAALDDEALAFDPEAYLEDDEEDAILSGAVDLSDHEGFSADLQEGAASQYAVTTLRAGLIKGKNGQVAPLGLPNRPLESNINDAGLALGALGTTEVDFEGDEVQLVDYYAADAYEDIPKDILKRMGLKMHFNDQGEAEFTEREGHEAVDLPLYLFDGNVDARAAAFVADLLDDDEDEAELPALAKRTPIVLAAAVQS